MDQTTLNKKRGVPEGADKETHERCVQHLKEDGHDKSSAYAICNEAGAGMKKEEIEFAKNGQWNLKKSADDSFVDIASYDDGSIDLEFFGNVPESLENTIVERLLSKGFEEQGVLEKAKKKKKDKDWSPKAKHKSDKGGLTEEGRKSYNKKTGGNLKKPQPEGGPRKRSFCARNKGQIDKHNIDCKKTPEKRACKARRRWKC